jgi:hypothetical protein
VYDTALEKPLVHPADVAVDPSAVAAPIGTAVQYVIERRVDSDLVAPDGLLQRAADPEAVQRDDGALQR